MINEISESSDRPGPPNRHKIPISVPIIRRAHCFQVCLSAITLYPPVGAAPKGYPAVETFPAKCGFVAISALFPIRTFALAGRDLRV